MCCVLKKSFSMIGFSETWLSDHVSPLLHLDNYTLVESHRDKKRGGGVCLYVNDTLSFVKRPDLSVFNEIIDSLFIEVRAPHSNEKVVIGVLYRPPKSSTAEFITHFHNLLSVISSEKSDCYIMGDFNINMLNSVTSNDLLNTASSNGFYPVICKPTRVSSTSASLIDNFFTNVSYMRYSRHICY